MKDDSIEQTVHSLREAYAELRDDVRHKWNRDLPFQELLFDRWERARDLGFGENASIYHDSCIFGDVKVGRNTWIGPFTVLDGSGGLTIGGYCSISAGVHIYSHDSIMWALSAGREEYSRSPVSIGDCCHIGAQATVLKGVSIGHHCVIGAGSVVNRDIPAWSVAVGAPCRIIGTVELHEDGSVSIRKHRESATS